MQNEFCLHWLTFTVFENPKRASWIVLRLLGLDNVMPDEFFRLLGSGGRGYTEIYQSSEGVRIYQKPNDFTERYTVEIPGEVLKTISWSTLQIVFQDFNHAGVRWQVSRCDYAFDLHKNKLTPVNLVSYLRMGGAVFTPSERESWKTILSTMRGIDGQKQEGNTQSFGSRSSERYVRIYDEHGFTRVEMETKSKRANLLFKTLLMDNVTQWAKTALSFLLDFLDFPENAFWKQFKEGCIRAGILIASHLSLSVQRSIDWINKQVSPTLFMLSEIYGLGSLNSSILKAEDRLNERQLLMMKLKPVLNFF